MDGVKPIAFCDFSSTGISTAPGVQQRSWNDGVLHPVCDFAFFLFPWCVLNSRTKNTCLGNSPNSTIGAFPHGIFSLCKDRLFGLSHKRSLPLRPNDACSSHMHGKSDRLNWLITTESSSQVGSSYIMSYHIRPVRIYRLDWPFLIQSLDWPCLFPGEKCIGRIMSEGSSAFSNIQKSVSS